MKYCEEYYNRTISEYPSRILKRFFDMKLNETLIAYNAVDLGCGAGNDVAFLLKKGFRVTAIDKEEKVVDIIKNRTNNNKNLKFIVDEFEKVNFQKNDLIISNFSLFFCNPEKFNILMQKVIDSINEGGYFVRQFFRKR